MAVRSFDISPIKGVDGILGVVIMLSYFVGGRNLFPSRVDPEKYIFMIKEERGGKVIIMDDKQLAALVDVTATAMDRTLKSLTMGSLKVYLSNLRNGKKPNGGALPLVPNFYSTTTGRMVIAGRDFDIDTMDGTFNNAPDWVRTLAPRPEEV